MATTKVKSFTLGACHVAITKKKSSSLRACPVITILPKDDFHSLYLGKGDFLCCLKVNSL